jgi:hypothetical protein
MPSLHAAFPLLGSLFALRLWGRRAWPTLLYTACVWLGIVYLGEHYVVDIIGGVVFTVIAFLGEEALATWWEGRRGRKAELEALTSARSSS